jgi:hypothetical protein
MTAITAAPTRLQWGHNTGGRPAGSIRPGNRWANPFKPVRTETGYDVHLMLGRRHFGEPYDHVATNAEARAAAVDLFDLHIGPMGSIEWDAETRSALQAQLGGRNLTCTCVVGSPCHVDVLLHHANNES